MLRQKIYSLIALAFFLLFVAIIFRPSFWQEKIDHSLKEQLSKQGWAINTNKFKGHLFTSLTANDVLLTHDNGASLYFPKINASLGLFSLLKKNIEIKYISVSNVKIRPWFDGNDIVKSPENIFFSEGKIPLNINSLEIDGDIFLPINEEIKKVNFQLNGKLDSDETNLSFDLKKFKLAALSPAMSFEVYNLFGFIEESKISAEFSNASINDLSFAGHIDYDEKIKNKLIGEITFDNYKVPEKIFSQFPLKPDLSDFTAQFNFKSDLNYFDGDLIIKNNLGLNMDGNFNVFDKGSFFEISNLSLSGNNTNLNLNGIYEKNGKFNSIMQLSNFDLSQWLIDSRATNLSGFILADGEFTESTISSVDLNVEINESQLFRGREASVAGGVSFFNNSLDITNPISLGIGSSLVTMSGNIDFLKMYSDLNLELMDASVFLINNFWSDSLNNGFANGFMDIKGSFKNINTNFNLNIEDFSYRDLNLKSFILNGDIKNINSKKNGFLNFKIGKGKYKNFIFDNGSLDISLDKNIIDVESFEIKNQNDYFQLNLIVEDFNKIELTRFQILYNQHYFANPRPITIHYGDKIKLLPFEIHADDGVLNGYFSTNPFRGNMIFSNVTTEFFKLFNNDIFKDLNGNLFGELSFNENDKNTLDLDITAKNGNFFTQDFDDLSLDLSYNNQLLIVDEFKLLDDSLYNFDVEGSVPIDLKNDLLRKVQIKSVFNNFDLSIFENFVPEIKNKIKGDYTGILDVSGTVKNTSYNLKGFIENTFYDKIPLGKVSGEMSYKDKSIIMSNVISLFNQNSAKASGKIPVDLDLHSINISKFYEKGKFELNSSGKFESAIFLTEYLSDIDSISGDISIDLSIKRDRKRYNRNGKIVVNNGQIYTVLMDEPVRKFNAEGILKNNLLEINSFNGSLNDSQNRKKDDLTNLYVSGEIDFERFFVPKYNLNINGNDIFYRSLNSDMEGYGDIQISLTGRDTIDITGKISAKNGALYTEFTNNDSETLTNRRKKTYTNYAIRFPIENTFSIRNSQIDAKVSGEIALSKQFDDDWNYSGEIEFVEGDIYYYLGDVFENLQGRMTFDGVGFNPFLELTASTKIGDANINLGVYGPFDNPEWSFNSDQGYSESDILQLLTFNTRVSEEGFSTEGLETQAQTMIGAYLEKQLERNFIKTTGLKATGLIEDVDISGTSELIRQNSDEEFSISAKLNQNFSLSYQRSFSLGSAYKNKVGVEYKLNPNVSLIGNVDETGKVHMKFRVRRVY